MPVWRAKPVAPAPVAKVGDRVKLRGVSRYLEVVQVHPNDSDGWPYEVEDGGCWGPQDVEDVYTAEEFARNSALVQYEAQDPEANEALMEGLGAAWANDQWYRCRWYFLTPDAASALGTFTPVPDRPIKAGDCVRHVATKKVGILGWVHGQGGYLEEGSKWVKLSLLTHVAPEDPAYIKPATVEAADADYDRKMDADFNSLDEESFAADLNTDVDWPADARARADQIAREFQRLANDVREWCPGYKRMGITKDEKRCYCDVSGWIEERASELLAAVQAEQSGGEG